MMPEVRDLSDALPEMPMDPITGVGVVASRNRAPTGYDVVSFLYCTVMQMVKIASVEMHEEIKLFVPPKHLARKDICSSSFLGVGLVPSILFSHETLWLYLKTK